ncbi:hypothetical protein BC835DRAFT_1304290 [Cytidiella melzeri]|nr:hypothetical protein BC835DRAFT_1304290 [Cytidiella melzeri]
MAPTRKKGPTKAPSTNKKGCDDPEGSNQPYNPDPFEESTLSRASSASTAAQNSHSRANSTTFTEEVREVVRGQSKIPRIVKKGMTEELDYLEDLYADPEEIKPYDSVLGRKARSSSPVLQGLRNDHSTGCIPILRPSRIESIAEEGEPTPGNESGRLNVIQGVIRSVWDAMRMQHEEMIEMREKRYTDVARQMERNREDEHRYTAFTHNLMALQRTLLTMTTT